MFRRLLINCCLLLPLCGCGSEDPTAELRALIDAAEIAAEERQTNHFRQLLSDNYIDSRGNDRDTMIDIIRGYFLTHRTLEIVTRIQAVQLVRSDVAEISVTAGVLGQRSGSALLGGLEGQLYDLELDLARQGGDWQIVGARWDRSLSTWDGN